MIRNTLFPPFLSFLAVLLGYCVYSGIVVPIVLPGAGAHLQDTLSELSPVDENNLASLFPKGSWELNCKWRFRQNNLVLLWNELEYVGEEVKFTPCTVLFLNDAEMPEGMDRKEHEQELYRQAVIMQTNDYALLNFDGEFSPTGIGGSAKFVKGELVGDVVVRSDMKEKSPEDDLYVKTNRIIFNEEKIQTDSEITFQYAKNQGSGRAMILSLGLSDLSDTKSDKTISRIELLKLHKLQLAFEDGKEQENGNDCERFEITCDGPFFFAPDSRKNDQWFASFLEGVVVMRVNESGSYDQLYCDRLNVYFGPNSKGKGTNLKNNELQSLRFLTPIQLLAQGKPARILSPMNDDFRAEGNRLEYDFLTRKIKLENDSPNSRVKLSVQGGKQSVLAGSLSYVFGEDGMFGQLIAKDQVELSGLTHSDKPEKEQRRIQLNCSQQLQAFPDKEDPNQVKCDLIGKTKLAMSGIGTMNAEEISIWFNQKKRSAPPVKSQVSRNTSATQPLLQRRSLDGSVSGYANRSLSTSSSAGKSGGITGTGFADLSPDRARIRKDVRFETPDGFCTVREMNIYFYEEGEQPRPGSTPYFAAAPMELASPNTKYAGAMVPGASPSSPGSISSSAPPPKKHSFLGGDSSQDRSRFELKGDLMRMLVRMDGGQAEIEKLFLHGAEEPVVFREIASKSDSPPIHIKGTELRTWYPSSDRTVMQILGEGKEPAVFTGRNMELQGLDVVFNQQSNRFRVEGSGKFETTQIALSGNGFSSAITSGTPNSGNHNVNAPGKANANGMLVVRWDGRLEFDGSRIRIESSEDPVRAMYAATGTSHPLQELQCNVLHIDLERPVSFVDSKSNPDAQVKRIECLGKVFFESLEMEGMQQKSIMRAENLEQFRIYPETGKFDGSNMGNTQSRLSTTFLGSAGDFNLLDRGTASDAVAKENSHQLKRVDIHFFDRILGNYKTFQVTASGSVICTFCPVPTWGASVDMNDIRRLKENGGYRLSCETLEAAKSVDPLDVSKSGIEVTAVRATRFEGQDVYVIAHIAKFNQLKDTIMVEGNGSVKAEIHIKRTPDGEFEPPISAQQMEYNIKTRDIKFKGIQGTQILNQ